MSISMIGIDHSMASVDIRAEFAFTKKNAGSAMEEIKKKKASWAAFFCLPVTAWSCG